MSRHPADWLRLFRTACSLIDQVNCRQAVIEDWTFGGGTAMMLQIGHRESHDVDIFLGDAQYLNLLNPERSDFDFDALPTAYHGDGTSFLKIVFEDVGEIDFIVGHAMTDVPTSVHRIEGRDVLLETIPEIIAKKIHYRGKSIKARDIFDIAAAAGSHESEIVAALRDYKTEVAQTLATIAQLNPEFVAGGIASLAIKEEFKDVALTALKRTKDILSLV
jgi:hypothetical protein